MAGAILITGLIIAHQESWFMSVAMIALVIGFLSFVLASQFLVTIEMGDSERMPVGERAKDLRLAIPFLFGYSAYIVAGVFICFYFITA